jgi:hypothetical protein
VEPVPAESQKESAKKFCGVSSRQITNRIRPKILWRQFPLYLKKNDVEKVDSVTNVLPNHKKNLPQISVEAVPIVSQKE